MKIVIDTSMIIDNLRNGSSWRVFIESLESDVELFVPTIVFFEIYSGVSTRNAQMVKKIQKIFSHFQSIQITETIARHAGELFRDVSHDLGAPDYIVAATALEIGATIATLNHKHFQKIPGVRVYEW